MISNGRRMAVTRQSFEVFRFPVMQSTFCFPNIAIITIPAASLINYLRPKGAVESVFIEEKRLNSASKNCQVLGKNFNFNSASVSENNLRIRTTIELVNT